MVWSEWEVTVSSSFLLQLPEQPGYELMLRSGKGEIGVFFTDTSIDNNPSQNSLAYNNRGSLFSTASIFADQLLGDIKPLMPSVGE